MIQPFVFFRASGVSEIFSRNISASVSFGKSRECRSLKQWMRMRRVRLRRTWNVAEQFLLAATAQNLKRLVRFLAQCEAQERSTT
jgi:hypothetical protein